MGKLVSPLQAATSLGISESTIKRCCDRGLLEFQRTLGGHRRLAISEVVRYARLTESTLVRSEAIGLPAGTGRDSLSLSDARERFLRHLVAGREQDCRRIALDLFLAGERFATICDHVLVPTFATIGELWTKGDVDVFEEHRSSEFCQRLLTEWTELLPDPSANAPLAIGCTPPGDPYAIPSLAVQMSLIEVGWHATTLGRGVPFASMEAALQKLRPQLFWVSVSSVADPEQFVHDYNDFYDAARQMAIPVVVGGRALDSSLRTRMRFSAYGDHLQHLQEFAESLTAGNGQSDDNRSSVEVAPWRECEECLRQS